MDKNSMSANELLACLAHSDLQEGEAIIKIGGRYVVCGISDLEVHAQAGYICEVEFKGYVK